MPFINITPFKNECRKIFLRRGLSEQRRYVVLEEGELVYLLDKKRIFVGDNLNNGGFRVSNFNFVNRTETIDYESKDSLKNVKDEVLKIAGQGDMVFDFNSGNTYGIFTEIDQCDSKDNHVEFFRNVGCSKSNIDSLTGSYLLRSGGRMRGGISMGGNNYVRNLPNPIQDYELANKQYVDVLFDGLKTEVLALSAKISLLVSRINALLLARKDPEPPKVVNYPPKIVTPVKDIVTTVGSAVTFNVEAYGDGDITYEWYIS